MVGAVLAWPLAISVMLVPIVARYIPGTRAHAKARLEHGWKPAWPVVRRLWATAHALYSGPTGPCAELTPECLALRLVAQDSSPTSLNLQNAIDEQNIMLSAYCVLALALRNEYALLRTLPPWVAHSSQTFRHQVGCLSQVVTLAELIQTELASA